MSQDTIPFGDDHETFASFNSIVLNVALVLVISLLLSLVTVVLTNGYAQVGLIVLGAIVIGFFAYQFSESFFLSIAVAFVMVKPTIVAAALDGNPEIVGVFALITAVVTIPEFIRLTRHTRRTLNSSLDALIMALPIGWMVWVGLVEPLRLAGIPAGVAWILGIVDGAILLQAFTMLTHRVPGGLWRILWTVAVSMSTLIDIITADVVVNQQQYLPVLALASVTVAARPTWPSTSSPPKGTPNPVQSPAWCAASGW